MTESQSAALDDLLSRWHAWQQGAKASRGFAPKALVCGEYRTSRQYDDGNGALDSDLEALRSRQVDHEVRQMAEPHRTAVYCEARNLSTGWAVWESPRLPRVRAEREAIIAEARHTVFVRVVAAGLI
jgi:hypothetical protein